MGLRYCVLSAAIKDIRRMFCDYRVFYPKAFTHCFMLYAMFYSNERMFSAMLSLNNPFSLQQIQQIWVWNCLHLCILGLQNGWVLSLQICSLASIFHFKLKTQAFQGMSEVPSKLWLLFLHMQGSISLNLSYWYTVSLILRQLCHWYHHDHSMAFSAGKPVAN